MKKCVLFLLLGLLTQTVFAQALSYYLPNNVKYHSQIPTPKSVLGHEVGEWHVTHDKLLAYMRAIDAASERVSMVKLGTTYEGREQIVLVITALKNQQNLEQIRQEHLRLTEKDPSSSLSLDKMPLVVWMGHSIHGNESSGSNAALLTAYYLAAAEGNQIDKILNNTIILLDPSFNPDGLNRFASWANTHKSLTAVADPNAREFNEIWPGGRFNHYWFDLNRDWLPAQHRESSNRLAFYHQWKPNILTDHHEQGSNASFFFQPGVTSRVNPNTPLKNQTLTAQLAKFHAHVLDSIGSMYFTKEGYDDFYYGKGSTYPDINGCIGILFEQASSRGHLQETDNGLLSFPFTIRNQFNTALSTLEGGIALRKDLLNYQQNFYKAVASEAAAFPTKAYLFGDEQDPVRTQIFAEMLLKHQIQIYPLNRDLTADGKLFSAGKSFVIPTDQQQFKIIKTVFEKTFEYKDSLFYDVTAWTMSLAFGMPTAELKALPNMGNRPIVDFSNATTANLRPKNAYAYAFGWNHFNAPKLLYQLQSKGIMTKVSTQKFTAQLIDQKKEFDFGTILIPVGIQKIKGEAFRIILEEAIAETGIRLDELQTGFSESGVDLGSSSFANIQMPKIMLFGGAGTSATDVGEIWHLMDTRFQIPVSIVDVDRFNAINPSKYNVVIMPSGTYANLDKNAQEKLRSWVAAGGTLVATEDATKFLANNGFTKVSFRTAQEKSKDSLVSLPYYLQNDERRAKEMPGSIFEASMELSHPICYGYAQPLVSVFKSNTLFMNPNPNPYGSPVRYTQNPLQSGYLYRGLKSLVSQSAMLNIDNLGKGKVISMVDNLNFRAFWLGTTKIFVNSLYFSDLIKL